MPESAIWLSCQTRRGLTPRLVATSVLDFLPSQLLRGPLIGQLGHDVGHIRRVHSQPRVSPAAQGLCGLSIGRACA